MRRNRLAWIVLIAVLTAGCGVRPSAVIPGGPAPTKPAWGAVLYFVADSALTPVLRSTPENLVPMQALVLLQDGPNGDERAVNLTSEVPAGLGPVAVTANASGNVDVVVSADVTTLSAVAVDQIVCTVRDALPTAAPITLTNGAATRGPRTCPYVVGVPEASVPGPPIPAPPPTRAR